MNNNEEQTKKYFNNVIIKSRNDTSANWNNSSYILAEGEIGIDTTNNIIKIGDGVNNWCNIKPISTSDITFIDKSTEQKTIINTGTTAVISNIADNNIQAIEESLAATGIISYIDLSNE